MAKENRKVKAVDVVDEEELVESTMTIIDEEAEAEVESTKPAEPSFSPEVLRKNCKELFDVEVEVFDGAFYGKPSDAKFTKAQAKRFITTFLNKEVK